MDEFRASSNSLQDKLLSLKQMLSNSSPKGATGTTTGPSTNLLNSTASSASKRGATGSVIADASLPASFNSPTIDIDAYPVRQGGSEMKKSTASPMSNAQKTPLNASGTTSLDPVFSSFNQTFETEEVQMLRDHSRFLYNKIVALEENVNQYIAKNKFLEEENTTLETQLKTLAKKVVEYEEVFKVNEKLHKDEVAELKQNLERVNAKIEIQAQKLDAAEKANVTMEGIRKEVRVHFAILKIFVR